MPPLNLRSLSRVKAKIRDIPDFPKPGIVFKDITPVLADPALFREVIDAFSEAWRGARITKVVGIESRGFVFASPLAVALNAGLILVRKPGKLPYKTVKEAYSLEYGTDTLELHEDAIAKGDRTLIVDDLLATGGTAGAVGRLVSKLGGEVVGYSFLIELGFLEGAKKLGADKVHAFIRY